MKRNTLAAMIRTMSIAIFFTVAMAINISAATFTVNNNDDNTDLTPGNGICADASGRCTLRAAVEEANAFAGFDTINFAASVNRITLFTGREIVIANESLSIVGRGANLLTIAGVGSGRIFSSANIGVTITGMTLTGGRGAGASSSGSGGAIFVSSGSLTLDGVHVTANSATLSGGGIAFNRGVGFIRNTTFSANTAANGCGGLYNFGGNLGLFNSTISGNTATGNSGGGGFCNNGGSVTLRSVTITNNTAPFGGGIYQPVNGDVNLGNTIVSANTGTSDNPEIYVTNGNVTSAGNNLVGDAEGDAENNDETIVYQSKTRLAERPLRSYGARA